MITSPITKKRIASNAVAFADNQNIFVNDGTINLDSLIHIVKAAAQTWAQKVYSVRGRVHV